MAAANVLGAGLFGNTQVVKAIQPVYETIREYPGELYGFFFGRQGDTGSRRAKTPPPPGVTKSAADGTVGGQREEMVSKEEVKRKLSFAPPLFGYLPEHVSLDDIYVVFHGDRAKADDAFYRFKDADGKLLYVTFRRLNEETAGGVNLSSNGAGVQKIEIDGKPAVVKYSMDGSMTLQIFRQHLLVEISGNIQQKEAIKIVQHLENDPSQVYFLKR